MSPEPPRTLRWLLPVVILLVTFGVHAPSIGNDFVFDDRSNVKAFDEEKAQRQEMIADLQPLSVYFTSHYLRGAASSSRGYRPITVLSYAWTFHMFCGGEIERDSPLPHHLINVLLQVLNTWLVLLILLAICPGWPAWAGSLVFGVHSIHAESVAGIVGRGELLGFCFGALSLLLYLRAMERAGRARGLHLFGTAAALFLAFCSKEGSLAWFAFLPIVRVAQHLAGAPAVQHLRRDILAAALAGIAPVAVFVGLYVYVVSNAGEYATSYLTNPLVYADSMTRIRTATIVWGYAIYKTLAPFGLSCDYGANVFTLARSFADYRVWLNVALLLGLVIGGFRAAKRHPLLFLAMACFFGFSFIVSNVPLAQETIFAERNYYTPSLALSLVVAWALSRAVSGTARSIALGIVALWCAACGVTDVQRMLDWRTNDTLFLHDMQVQPRSLRLLDCAAEAHRSQNRMREYHAILDAQLAVEPEFPKALIATGQRLVLQRRFAAAETFFDRCRNSRLLPLIERTNYESRLYYNVGQSRLAQGRAAEAVSQFEDAVRLDSTYAKSWYFLIRACVSADRLDLAAEALDGARGRFERDLVLEMLRGKILLHREKFAEAERVLQGVLPRMTWGTYIFDDTLDVVEAVSRQGRKRDAMRLLDGFLKMGGGEAPPEDRARVDLLRRL